MNDWYIKYVYILKTPWKHKYITYASSNQNQLSDTHTQKSFFFSISGLVQV